MTKGQRKAVRKALRRHDGTGPWQEVLERTREYYAREDPVCWRLLELRYLEGQREEKVIQALYVGRSTYYAKQAEALSTVAVYAAQAGLLEE